MEYLGLVLGKADYTYVVRRALGWQRVYSRMNSGVNNCSSLDVKLLVVLYLYKTLLCCEVKI